MSGGTLDPNGSSTELLIVGLVVAALVALWIGLGLPFALPSVHLN